MATTHTMQDIESVVFSGLESFGADAQAISRNATLEQLDIDSLDMVELGQLIHEELGISLAPKDFEGVTTVGGALSIIESRASGS